MHAIAERDERGRLLPGHRLSAGNRGGNPALKRMAELRRVVLEKTTDDDVIEAVEKLRTLGMEGDVQALRLWLEFTIGKPTTPIEVSMDGPAPPDIATIAAVVVEAVGPDSEARFKIAAALARIGRAHRGDDDDDDQPGLDG